MKIIDLTHEINLEMSVYPETESPSIKELNTFDTFGVNVKEYKINGHIGTHIDLPKHIDKFGATTSTLNISSFYGQAAVVDCSALNESDIINIDMIDSDLFLQNFDYLLFYTGWSQYWGSDRYFGKYPVFSLELARKISKMKILGVGFDTISVDSIDGELINHKLLLLNNKVIVENLTNLKELIGKKFIFSALPLKFRGGDGSPIRAVGILD